MKWISVKDRLPEFNHRLATVFPRSNDCIVKDKNNKKSVSYLIKGGLLGDNEIFIAWRGQSDIHKKLDDIKKFSESITHWMLLEDLPNE